MEEKSKYKLEWERFLDKLEKANLGTKEFKYFLEIGKNYPSFCAQNNKNGRVIMLGYSFPEEIIRAMNLPFTYVFGGSYESTLFKDISYIKDSDDQTKSILGILKSKELNISKKDVLLIPLINDNYKKLPVILADEVTIICYEVPFKKEDISQQRRYINEVKRVIKLIEKHFRKKLLLTKLNKECRISRNAAIQFEQIESQFKNNHRLSASTFLYLANSYHMGINKKEWIHHLELLNNEINRNCLVKENINSNVLLVGSPIYPPNYGFIFNAEEINLNVQKIIHPDIEHIKSSKLLINKVINIKSLVLFYLKYDISPIYTNSQVVKLLDTKSDKISGIIYYLLRGQIQYDYEKLILNELAIKHNTPFNAIETLYDYEEFEQIRLRLEAFKEIIV